MKVILADELPDERGERQECPHGVDDGACKQCYGEAVSGGQGTALRMLDSIITDMQSGFVKCENCGEQEDTATLDFMSPLRELRSILAASVPTLTGGNEVVSPAELRSHARTIRMKEDNQGSIDRDCAEAAEALEWAALIIEAYKPQPQAAEPKGLSEYREALRDTLLALQCADCSELSPELEGKVRLARALLTKGE